MKKNILITGGAGFIGCHVVQLFVQKYPEYHIINLDCLTYAGNLENLSEIENSKNYTFEKVNILDVEALTSVFEKHQITDVIHLAAESHVDRSITDPLAFVKTNIIGTVNHMVIGEDVAFGAHDHPGTQAGLHAALLGPVVTEIAAELRVFKQRVRRLVDDLGGVQVDHGRSGDDHRVRVSHRALHHRAGLRRLLQVDIKGG